MDNLEINPRTGVDSSGNDAWPEAYDAYWNQARYWLEGCFEEAKHENESSEEVKEVQKFIDYLAGKQWPGGRPSYKSRPVWNKIWPLFWELVSLLTDIKPIAETKALDKAFEHQARIINKLNHSWWLASDADLHLALICMYGLLCTGYAKLTWNDRLRNREGDFELLPLGPTDVLPVGVRNSLQTAQAVIYQTVMPLSWFRERFPLTGARVKANSSYSKFEIPSTRPAHISPMLYDMLSPQMRRLVGEPSRIGTSTFPRALYREFWIEDHRYNTSNMEVQMGPSKENWAYKVKPGQLLYPRGRLIIMGGEHILHDGPNPYWHGRPPFAALRLNPVPWQWHGLNEMRPLMASQDIISNILAGVMDAVKKAVNPAFMAPKNAFSENVWGTLDWSMPGARAAFSPISPHKPDFVPPPQLPTFVLQVMQMVEKGMERSSGIAAMSDMLKKKQVPSGDTLDQIRQAQQTPIRMKGRHLEVFLRELGTMSIPNIFQFYSKRRRVFMLGQEGLAAEDFDYDPDTMIPDGKRPEDHVRNFVFEIHPGSLLNAQKVEKAMLYLNLRKMGDISRRALFQELDMGLDADQIDAEIKHEREDGVGAMPAKGRGAKGAQLPGSQTKQM